METRNAAQIFFVDGCCDVEILYQLVDVEVEDGRDEIWFRKRAPALTLVVYFLVDLADTNRGGVQDQVHHFERAPDWH
eukprot:CAMPEP_0179443888 /NCGR_PEP_ID=MMETSP0799-20121207/27357_1 /TAXON_ID=46947 /ORGANISM="Geminigera cryophila, Strain CCMP2564" /LENGTH=77 /DNA_ID=CAMNT_0021230427 /DNA_START=177 /DNA_END=410 /DNA_ORIENTATION=+